MERVVPPPEAHVPRGAVVGDRRGIGLRLALRAEAVPLDARHIGGGERGPLWEGAPDRRQVSGGSGDGTVVRARGGKGKGARRQTYRQRHIEGGLGESGRYGHRGGDVQASGSGNGPHGTSRADGGVDAGSGGADGKGNVARTEIDGGPVAQVEGFDGDGLSRHAATEPDCGVGDGDDHIVPVRGGIGTGRPPRPGIGVVPVDARALPGIRAGGERRMQGAKKKGEEEK